MAKKILILNGSPRANGNTSALTAQFKKGAEEAGNTVTEFQLSKMKIGGCLGCFFAKLFGLDPMLYTACGMTAMFAGMTNAPVSSLLLAFELFGYAGMPYFVLSIAVAFALSGYYGLYAGQHFSSSKLRPAQIHRKGPRSSWTKEE